MDMRAFLVLTCAASVSGLTVVTSCSGPDPGEITFRERPDSGGGLSSGSSGSQPSPTGEGGVDEGGAGEGGMVTDGGTPVPEDKVFGSTTYSAATPTGPNAPANAQGGNNHGGSVEGKNCLQGGCHAAGGGGPNWAFAGTVYDAAGAATVKDVEVWVTGPDGKVYGKTKTDANGNFWMEKAQGMGDIPQMSRVGIRNATISVNMTGNVNGAGSAGCSQAMTCHGGDQGKILLKKP